jgi:hypothetical protein
MIFVVIVLLCFVYLYLFACFWSVCSLVLLILLIFVVDVVVVSIYGRFRVYETDFLYFVLTNCCLGFFLSFVLRKQWNSVMCLSDE